MSLIEKIGIDNVLNVILVNENVRPAMLVQPADYGESTHNDPKTKSIIESIKEYFPNLLFSQDYEIYQGVIISNTDEYNGRKDISLEKMGEILGYPCYKDFTNRNPDEMSYGIEVYVQEKNGKVSQLFANRCKDETNIEKFKTFAEKAKIAFDKEEYKDILQGVNINKVDVNIDRDIPIQMIINHLIENKELEQEEIYQIQNILFNFGFSIDFKYDFIDIFQYSNPIHKGILLGLLLNDKNNLLSPFVPLQNYPNQDKQVNEIIEAWEKDILDILEKTKLPSMESSSSESASNQSAGKKKKNRKRTIKLLSKRKISRRKTVKNK